MGKVRRKIAKMLNSLSVEEGDRVTRDKLLSELCQCVQTHTFEAGGRVGFEFRHVRAAHKGTELPWYGLNDAGCDL